MAVVLGLVIKTLTGFKGPLAVERASVYERHNNLQDAVLEFADWLRDQVSDEKTDAKAKEKLWEAQDVLQKIVNKKLFKESST